jgi:hypothetical protein
MIEEFGEENYVRWLDDQNIAVRSMTEARRVVNTLTRSLSSQRLTVNSGKTKFLTPEKVLVHFQLDANAEIDSWDSKFKDFENVSKARRALNDLWQRISAEDNVQVGNWGKILKRMYAASTKANSDLLERRALEDLVEYPELDERIFQYFAKRNRGDALLKLFSDYCAAGENLFEGTESVFFESLLLLDPGVALAPKLRQLALQFASASALGQSGKPLGRASALLAVYWLGESGSALASIFNLEAARRLPKEVARAWIATVTALNPSLLRQLQSKLVGHPSDDVARLSSFLSGLLNGTIGKLGNYKNQRSRWPLPGKFYDARSWLTLHLASSSLHEGLRATLRRDLKSFQALVRTIPEKRIAVTINRRLGRAGHP